MKRIFISTTVHGENPYILLIQQLKIIFLHIKKYLQ